MLYANANLPNGSTLEQMNTLIKRMETYLSGFKEIKQFQTSVESARRASISIHFTKENQKSGFPYTLKANMISKALQLGGGDWSIYGLYNPQIQISAESETKRSIFREKDKTKRSKKESAQHSKSRNKSFVMTSVSAL